MCKCRGGKTQVTPHINLLAKSLCPDCSYPSNSHNCAMGCKIWKCLDMGSQAPAATPGDQRYAVKQAEPFAILVYIMFRLLKKFTSGWWMVQHIFSEFSGCFQRFIVFLGFVCRASMLLTIRVCDCGCHHKPHWFKKFS